MAKKKSDEPFVEDGSQFGVSRTAFRRMRKAEKRELMIAWFHQNFEDPAERTSYVSAEGGYLWNHGGPYDAGEQLYDKFGDIVPESLVQEVAEAVEEDGLTDWAPTPRRDDYYDENDEPPPESPSLDSYGDDPTPKYGSKEDLEVRERVRATLAELRATMDQPRPVGIGHNNPPEDDAEAEEIEKLRPAVIELQAEFAKFSPSISLVKKLAAPLRAAALASLKWVGRKLDKAIDATMAAAGPAIVVAVGATYNDALRKAFDAVLSWLDLVAHKIF